MLDKVQANDFSWNYQRTEAAGQTTDSKFGNRQGPPGRSRIWALHLLIWDRHHGTGLKPRGRLSRSCNETPMAAHGVVWACHPEGHSRVWTGVSVPSWGPWPRMDWCERAVLRPTAVHGLVWVRCPEGHRHTWTSVSVPSWGPRPRMDWCERAILRPMAAHGLVWARHPEAHGRAWLTAYCRASLWEPFKVLTRKVDGGLKKGPLRVLARGEEESSHGWNSAQTFLFCPIKNKIPPLQGGQQNRGLRARVEPCSSREKAVVAVSIDTALPISPDHPPKCRRLTSQRKSNRPGRRTLWSPLAGELCFWETQEHMPAQQGM